MPRLDSVELGRFDGRAVVNDGRCGFADSRIRTWSFGAIGEFYGGVGENAGQAP